MENHQLQNYLREEMKSVSNFKTHLFPVKRIKTIMKTDPDVVMVSGDAAILLSKACEFFTLDLTMRSWHDAEEKKQTVVRRSNISEAVARTINFDFLLDIFPKGESESVVAFADPGFVPIPTPDGGLPQFYHPVPETVMGAPVLYTPAPTQEETRAWADAWMAAAGDGENEAGENEGNNGGGD